MRLDRASASGSLRSQSTAALCFVCCSGAAIGANDAGNFGDDDTGDNFRRLVAVWQV